MKITTKRIVDDHDLVIHQHSYNQHHFIIDGWELFEHLETGKKVKSEMEYGGGICEVEIKIKMKLKKKE